MSINERIKNELKKLYKAHNKIQKDMDDAYQNLRNLNEQITELEEKRDEENTNIEFIADCITNVNNNIELLENILEADKD